MVAAAYDTDRRSSTPTRLRPEAGGSRQRLSLAIQQLLFGRGTGWWHVHSVRIDLAQPGCADRPRVAHSAVRDRDTPGVARVHAWDNPHSADEAALSRARRYGYRQLTGAVWMSADAPDFPRKRSRCRRSMTKDSTSVATDTVTNRSTSNGVADSSSATALYGECLRTIGSSQALARCIVSWAGRRSVTTDAGGARRSRGARQHQNKKRFPQRRLHAARAMPHTHQD